LLVLLQGSLKPSPLGSCNSLSLLSHFSVNELLLFLLLFFASSLRLLNMLKAIFDGRESKNGRKSSSTELPSAKDFSMSLASSAGKRVDKVGQTWQNRQAKLR
jgi:hypothetical protein